MTRKKHQSQTSVYEHNKMDIIQKQLPELYLGPFSDSSAISWLSYAEPRPSLLVRCLVSTETIGVRAARSRQELRQQLHWHHHKQRRQFFGQIHSIAHSEPHPPFSSEQLRRLCIRSLTDQPHTRTNLTQG